MNTIEKAFHSIKTASTWELKLFSTRELVKQLREYDDYTLYILKSIYELLVSENTHCRLCGAKILHCMSTFEYTLNFTLSGPSATTNYVYLQFKNIETVAVADIKRQKLEIQKALSMKHVGTDFLGNVDMAGTSVNVELNTAEYIEKNIENVFDFFEAINLILLSPDWFKRHGGFIAYCAIVSSCTGWDFDTDILGCPGTVPSNAASSTKQKITLSGDIFGKIYEILKNDKFNDFQENVTSSPVKEVACVLLKYVYPMLNNKLVLHEITHLLASDDWQEQFASLLALTQLRDHFTQDLVDAKGLVDNFLDMLIDLLMSEDEDVKFHSADLLGHIVERYTVDEQRTAVIRTRCWEQIESELDIAHSKASILILLKILYAKGDHPVPTSYASLYPCFTSPIELVRNSAIELSKVFSGEEFIYLLAECVLLEQGMSHKHTEILQQKIAGADRCTLEKFVGHMFGILSMSLDQPYCEDDFACYDEAFFTPDGIRGIGRQTVLNNRAVLFSLLREIKGVKIDVKQTLLGKTFELLYGLDGTRGDSHAIVDLQSVILADLDAGMRLFGALKKIPVKEIAKIVQDPFYHSLYPQCHENCTELVRMESCRHIADCVDFVAYFALEYSSEFLRVFTESLAVHSAFLDTAVMNLVNLLISTASRHKEVTASRVDDCKTHEEVVLEQTVDNLVVFFGVLGQRGLELQAFDRLLASPDRLLFFQHTAENYLTDPRLGDVFDEALCKKDTVTLKKFITNIEYNSKFVRHVLETSDIALLADLIEYSDQTFNVLFVKLVLKSPMTSASRALLSRILCTLHFETSPEITDQDLIGQIKAAKAEVEMIVEPGKIPEYQIDLPHRVDLRSYQREGIKWMSFLHRFHLNGILADDMGLGKTVQVLVFVLNEMYIKGGRGDAQQAIGQSGMTVLILCPSSITTHWKGEIEKFFDISATIYDAKKGNGSASILVYSYDAFRRDSGLEKRLWSTVVFDEGHLLKNRKTMLFTKCAGIHADSKIVLTGTPVHNSVEDMYSLFEIILPGYLGTESTFCSQYSCKVTDKNVQVMAKRLDALHKKTLPFVMRRLKSDVLSDLPPKVIKDLTVEMSPKHAELYTSVSQGEDDSKLARGYAALKNDTLLRLRDSLKAATHPHYFDPSIPSSKTAVLVELFEMCANSKVLVFFQLKSTIDFVLHETGLKNVLRLDGSVPASKRGEIVTKFNTEAIPYLFLTTGVGGLGLNLTSADVVVFYEHDWNPFNDLQAMDRAHRLGQKKTVNVFRLICKDTVEEKVMNYQNFKLYVANTLVTQQNNEITKMDTKDILERFEE